MWFYLRECKELASSWEWTWIALEKKKEVIPSHMMQELKAFAWMHFSIQHMWTCSNVHAQTPHSPLPLYPAIEEAGLGPILFPENTEPLDRWDLFLYCMRSSLWFTKVYIQNLQALSLHCLIPLSLVTLYCLRPAERTLTNYLWQWFSTCCPWMVLVHHPSSPKQGK